MKIVPDYQIVGAKETVRKKKTEATLAPSARAVIRRVTTEARPRISLNFNFTDASIRVLPAN